MSRHPEDLAAPPNQRPPHINPHWWYRATWRARQAAVDAYHRDTRTSDATHTEPTPQPVTPTGPLTRDEKTAAIEELLAIGHAPAMIANRFNTTVTALEALLRRAGRPDLARPFDRARSGAYCTRCGTETYRSELCRTCAAQVRESHKRSADDYLDEIEGLLALGCTHEEVIRHVGKSASALEKAARRNGRGDLARAFQRLRARTRQCIDCGTRVGKNSTRCKPCAGFMRETDRRTMRGAA
jgi:hypothetical protein